MNIIRLSVSIDYWNIISTMVLVSEVPSEGSSGKCLLIFNKVGSTLLMCLVNLGVRPSATLASLLYYSCSGQWCEALLADNIIKMINNPVWRQASVSDEESGASSLLEPGPVRRTRQRECDRVTVPGLGRR